MTVLATGMGMDECKDWFWLDDGVGDRWIWLNIARFSSIVVRVVDAFHLAK
jgi:hypothetical protein